MGIFGNAFDLNHDGMMDSFEKAAEFGAFMQMVEYEKNNELTNAGLNPQDLSQMGYSERYETLKNAGLDPHKYNL